MSDDGLKVDWN